MQAMRKPLLCFLRATKEITAAGTPQRAISKKKTPILIEAAWIARVNFSGSSMPCSLKIGSKIWFNTGEPPTNKTIAVINN